MLNYKLLRFALAKLQTCNQTVLLDSLDVIGPLHEQVVLIARN